jgi:hypothetical protein
MDSRYWFSDEFSVYPTLSLWVGGVQLSLLLNKHHPFEHDPKEDNDLRVQPLLALVCAALAKPLGN